jgi:hypothetical protein
MPRHWHDDCRRFKAATEENAMTVAHQTPVAPQGAPPPEAPSETPVFGTAQADVHGPAEQLRQQAYRRPTHDPMHWLLLLAADRAESAGTLLRETVQPGQQQYVVRHFARQARSYPMGFAGAAAATALAAVLLGWRVRSRGR